MGVLTAGFGVALTAPQSSSALIAVLTLYTVHHLLVKGGLFLGIGFLERGVARTATLATLVFLSLALAGAPLTSGAIAKMLLNNALPQEWSSLYWLLTASSVGSTLLMGRFLYLALRISPHDSTSAIFAWIVWLLLVLSIISAPFMLSEFQASTRGWEAVLLAAIVVVIIWTLHPQRLSFAIGLIPAGDALYLTHWRKLSRLKNYFSRSLAVNRERLESLQTWVLGNTSIVTRRWRSFSDLPNRWPLVGTVWLALVSLIYLSLAWIYP